MREQGDNYFAQYIYIIFLTIIHEILLYFLQYSNEVERKTEAFSQQLLFDL